MTPLNLMRLKSIINMNSLSFTIHAPALKITGEFESDETSPEQPQRGENDVEIDEDASGGVEMMLRPNPNAVVRGTGIFQVASFMNHSCDPNAIRLPALRHSPHPVRRRARHHCW
jgi:hypothetical protein